MFKKLFSIFTKVNIEKNIINEIIQTIGIDDWEKIKKWEGNYLYHNIDLSKLKIAINIFDKNEFYTGKTIKYLCELEAGIEWHVENQRRENILKRLSKDDKEKYKDFFRDFDKYGIRAYKKSVSQQDDGVCENCRINEKVGWIFFDEEFPSGHLTYPSHKGKESCRCYIQYSLTNPNTGNLFDK